MHKMKYNQAITVTKEIEASRGELWNFISSPEYLNDCHPFCKKNTIIKWEKGNHSDILEYLNGLVYMRNFFKWEEKRGYSLLIGEENKQQSKVVWEINSQKNKTFLTITVYPYFLSNYPKFISFVPYKFLIKPKLKSYLNSVIGGINFYMVNKIPVKRNMYGKHSWFS